MTTSKAAELARRRRNEPTTLLSFDDLVPALEERVSLAQRLKFPSARFRADPVGFFRTVLGVEPWSKQIEIMEAVRDHRRVSAKSGHRVSKSHTAAGIGLWWYCSYDDARVVYTSTTARQVDAILWRELKMMKARSGRCVDCRREDPEGERIPTPCPHSAMIDGELGDLARTGLKSGFREIVGFTAREAEAVQGIAGAHLLFIVDEASGVDDAIFEALEGNRAGGAHLLLLGNPTKTSGEFFESHNEKARFYRCITISSEETPNVVQRREVIPGLATLQWIEEKQEEWGIDSALYRVRVKGEFALREDGKIFSLHAIAEAEKRWAETSDSGRLFIGVDPAGPSGSGDETVFAVRRGLKLLELIAMRGLSDEAHLVQLLGILARRRLPRELPVVVLDREGSVGAAVFGLFRSHVETARGVSFDLVAVRASDRAHRQPYVYDRVRDELAANLESWLRDGGAIPEDAKLEKELHELEWTTGQNGRQKLTAKTDIRKALGRSPDRYDAVALSVWEPLSLKEEIQRSALEEAPIEEAVSASRSWDPYSASGAWRR